MPATRKDHLLSLMKGEIFGLAGPRSMGGEDILSKMEIDFNEKNKMSNDS